MIRRIVLKNFMSHGSTIIEPAYGRTIIEPACGRTVNEPASGRTVNEPACGRHPDTDSLMADRDHREKDADLDACGHLSAGGLTVLVGENNSGKSAIVTALQVISQNASGDFMVRHGQTECDVTVETLDPETGETHVLTWRRHKGKVSYVIDGREIDRLKRNIPDDLHEKLRLAPVATTRDEFDIHIGEQKRPIFLLGDKSSDRAAFFASSSDTCKLIEMQELHRSKIKLAKNDRKQKTLDHEKLNGRLEILRPLTGIETRLVEIEGKRKKLDQSISRADMLSQLIELLRAATSEQLRHGTRLNQLDRLRPLPQISSTVNLRSMIGRMTKSSWEQNIASRRMQTMTSLSRPPAVKVTNACRELIDRIRARQRRLREVTDRQQVLARLTPLPTLTSPTTIAQMMENRHALSENLQAVGDSKKQLVKIAVEIEELKTEIGKHFDQLENCPTCGQKIDMDVALNQTFLHEPCLQPAQFASLERSSLAVPAKLKLPSDHKTPDDEISDDKTTDHESSGQTKPDSQASDSRQQFLLPINPESFVDTTEEDGHE